MIVDPDDEIVASPKCEAGIPSMICRACACGSSAPEFQFAANRSRECPVRGPAATKTLPVSGCLACSCASAVGPTKRDVQALVRKSVRTESMDLA